MTRPPRARLAVMKPSPVLITESADDFSRLRDDLKAEFKPHGAVEEFMVEDIAALMWDIYRYRRFKTSLINSAYRDALERLLERVCREPGHCAAEIQENKEELAYEWFAGDQTAKQLILESLSYFNLDERAIEAEAMRIMAPELAQADQMLASREWRLDKALRSFAEFRGVLAPYLRETAERLIDGKVLALGSASKNPPSAAA